MNYIQQHFEETVKIISEIDINKIEKMISLLKTLRDNKGRLFILGVGGSASNSSHAVNDKRSECFAFNVLSNDK